MTDETFFVAADASGHEFLVYGNPDKGLRGSFYVVNSRTHLDNQNQMLWRRVVSALTGEWPVCELPICDHEDRRHEGNCRTNIGISFGGGQ
jgi:hypothetical protein